MAVRLGIDASQPYASCAVSTDSGIIAALCMEKPIENFPALIRNTLAQAHMGVGDLDEIVVCIGPGSQTGVRAAAVTGNALALALEKPVTGVLSIDAAAVLAPLDKNSIAVPAGRRRWYVADYNRQGGRLCRLGELKLVDEPSSDSYLAFQTEFCSLEKENLCAYGILLVAEKQRHLITQSMLSEIMPYERNEDNGK